MPTDAIPSKDLEAAIASLRAGSSHATAAEAIQLPNWRDEDWRQLFGFTSIRRVMAGDALIRHGEPNRTLYFVLHGQLEVIIHSGDGLSMGRVALVGRGQCWESSRFSTADPGRLVHGRWTIARLRR
jgi:CRP/FNR family transcriptional regulator, cyclic AMP receptor protein